MESRRQTRPPVRRPVRRPAQRQDSSVRRPVREPVQRQGAPVNPVRRRRSKPKIDITLTILDFFANIGKGIKRGYLRARNTRHFRAVSAFVAIIFAISVAALVFFAATRPNALEIYLDDGSISIGTVRLEGNRQITPEYITLHATARLETHLGSHVRLISEIEANPVRVGTGTTVLTFDNLMAALIGALDYYAWGAIIMVDGTRAATLPSAQAAESLLTDIAQNLHQSNTVASFHNIFAQDIEIAHDYVPRAELMTREEAHGMLTTPREVPGIHIVQRGDTFWGISQITGMSISDIAAANPDVNPYELNVGQRLAVVHTIPVLSVRSAD